MNKAKNEKRQAEFGQARAEQLAIARGEALYRCQERLADAEQQQVQLADVLKGALNKMGMTMTPSPAPRRQSMEGASPEGDQFTKDQEAGLEPLGSELILDGSPDDIARKMQTIYDGYNIDDAVVDPNQAYVNVYSNEMHNGEGSPPKTRPSTAEVLHHPDLNDRSGASESSLSSKSRNSTRWKDFSEALAAKRAECGQEKNERENGEQLAVDPLPIATWLQSPLAEDDPLHHPFVGSSLFKSEKASCSSAAQKPDGVHTELHSGSSATGNSSIPERKVHSGITKKESHSTTTTTTTTTTSEASKKKRRSRSEGTLAVPDVRAAGWMSPEIEKGDGEHMKSVLGVADAEQFYLPFSAGLAEGTMINRAERKGTQQVTSSMMPPPPAVSMGKSKIGPQSKAADGYIKAGRLEEIEEVYDEYEYQQEQEEEDIRRQRAIERLSQRVNQQVPPEQRVADPLGLTTKYGRRNFSYSNYSSRATSESKSTSSSPSLPGSLRRYAELQMLREMGGLGDRPLAAGAAAASEGYRPG